jgi:hypothetical protein
MAGFATELTMNRDELRELAEMEGNAFGECDPSDPSWTWQEELFEVARVVGGPLITMSGTPMDREAWLRWLNEEISEGARGGSGYVDRLALTLREAPDALDPVIVALHSNGRIEIGDGWHRFAIAVRDGIPVLRAAVGTRTDN